MQDPKQSADRVVLRFRLSERVPKQHLYRRFAELLYWNFRYAQTRALHCYIG